MTEALGVLGKKIVVDDPKKLKADFYKIRKANPELGLLSIITHPTNPLEFWIMNRGYENVEDS